MSKKQDKANKDLQAVRDTFESIWVAIILAFVLRAFMVEAFVIPTGSMAPRLLGEHLDLQCQVCGYEYSYGVPKEDNAYLTGQRGRAVPSSAADSRCPNCGAVPAEGDWPNSGDRVLVLKYLYNFSEPQPWDVVVFKNPQDNRQNYIKRLIGLPGETIEIVHGDVFVRTEAEEWHIRRKPRRAQDAMWQVIFDNDYRPAPDRLNGLVPPRWEPQEGDEALWDLDHAGRSFRFRGGAVPGVLDFRAQRAHFLPKYGYNQHSDSFRQFSLRRDIVSDIKLSAVLFPEEEPATVVLETTSFERRFRAVIDTAGTVQLWGETLDGEGASVLWDEARLPPMTPGQGYRVALVHVDLSVAVLVNDEVVARSEDGEYGADYAWIKDRMDRVEMQPIPEPEIRIAVGGGGCILQHVKVMRDVFYTQALLTPQPLYGSPRGDYARKLREAHEKGVLGSEDVRFRRVEFDQGGWGTSGTPIHLLDSPIDDLDEFFCLGDNSPHSLDGRGWALASPTLRLYDEEGNFQYQLGTVPRYSLVGRALFVYWPAGFRFPGLPDMPGVPIIPNFGRMRMIR